MSGDAEDLDLDSGFEAISSPDSPAMDLKETTPESSLQVAAPVSSKSVKASNRAALEDNDDDLDLDETILERLWGLTEMFPEPVRNTTSSLVSTSISAVQGAYSLSRSVAWVFFSSAAILAAPVIFEMERVQMEEMSKQQQRQILLGPSAAVQAAK